MIIIDVLRRAGAEVSPLRLLHRGCLSRGASRSLGQPSPNASSNPPLQVTVASVEDDLTVTCSRKVRLVADKSIQECAGDTFDLIALPVSGACAGVW